MYTLNQAGKQTLGKPPIRRIDPASPRPMYKLHRQSTTSRFLHPLISPKAQGIFGFWFGLAWLGFDSEMNGAGQSALRPVKNYRDSSRLMRRLAAGLSMTSEGKEGFSLSALRGDIHLSTCLLISRSVAQPPHAKQTSAQRPSRGLGSRGGSGRILMVLIGRQQECTIHAEG